MEKHTVSYADAPKVLGWFRDRGGIAIWRSINLSNPGASWTTPLRNADGTPTTKPSWQAANEPERVITDVDDVVVVTPKVVKRFRVAVRLGDSGLSLKLTDAASARVERETAKAGDEAWYEFDYSTQEALILVPEATVPLASLETVAQ